MNLNEFEENLKIKAEQRQIRSRIHAYYSYYPLSMIYHYFFMPWIPFTFPIMSYAADFLKYSRTVVSLKASYNCYNSFLINTGKLDISEYPLLGYPNIIEGPVV